MSHPIEEWYHADERVQSVINRLSNAGLTNVQQAEAAFEEFCVILQLPMYPDAFTEDDYEKYSEMGIDDPRSVFEELVLYKFMDPEADPRGAVMMALYHVFNGIQVPLEECAAKHYGGKEKVPEGFMVCFIGDGIHGRLHFLEKGESWFDLGARSAMKLV